MSWPLGGAWLTLIRTCRHFVDKHNASTSLANIWWFKRSNFTTSDTLHHHHHILCNHTKFCGISSHFNVSITAGALKVTFDSTKQSTQWSPAHRYSWPSIELWIFLSNLSLHLIQTGSARSLIKIRIRARGSFWVQAACTELSLMFFFFKTKNTGDRQTMQPRHERLFTALSNIYKSFAALHSQTMSDDSRN